MAASSDQDMREPLLAYRTDDYASMQGEQEDIIREPTIIIARLQHAGTRAINGLANRYAEAYPPAFRQLNIPQKEFQIAMIAINQTAEDYFPCTCLFLLGYVLFIVTFGLSSYCFQGPFIQELEENLYRILQRINCKDIFLEHGIRWDLQRQGWNSWIEISQLVAKHQLHIAQSPTNRTITSTSSSSSPGRSQQQIKIS